MYEGQIQRPSEPWNKIMLSMNYGNVNLAMSLGIYIIICKLLENTVIVRYKHNILKVFFHMQTMFYNMKSLLQVYIPLCNQIA